MSKLLRFSVCMVIALMGGMLSAAVSPLAQNQGPQARVGMHRGTPAMFVDGVPTSAMTYTTGWGKDYSRYFQDFGKAGVRFVSIIISPTTLPVWKGPGEFDFSSIDKAMNAVVSNNPNALIFPRVDLFSPPWWNERNRDEIMRFDDGATMKQMSRYGNTELPSWASETWRTDVADCLRRMIAHIQRQPYGNRVVGYHLSSGGTNEWYYYSNFVWFFNEPLEYYLDYSKPQTEAFRRWLAQKYGSDAALQAAWHNPKATLGTAEIASKRDKKRTDHFVFFDPAKSQHVVDTYDFEANLVVDTIEYFCKVVKDATGRKAFTGAFYGYVAGAVDKVYLATNRLLHCPDIDFLTAPSDYNFREPGSGYSTYRTVAESVRLHGKLWWDENDYYTNLTPTSMWVEGWTGPRTFENTVTQQIRQISNEIANASAGWWFDMNGGWYDSPESMEMVRNLNDIAERSVNTDRTSTAEIAFVVDEKSLLYISMNDPMKGDLYRPLIMDQRLPAGKIGAPVDWILMDDLGTARDYKMYVFLDAFRVTEKQKAEIKRLSSRGAKAVVWVYAPGYVGETLDVKGCFDLTGIRLKCLADKSPLQVEISPEGGKYLGVAAGAQYGTAMKIGPIIVGDDPSAQVLGSLYGVEGQGLITKALDGVQVYFSAAPTLSSPVLRGIAEKAGVHMYASGDDVLYMNKSFLGIHTSRPGKRTLHFPRPTDLYDAYNDKTVATKATNVTLDLPLRHSALYFMGTKQEWDALKKK